MIPEHTGEQKQRVSEAAMEAAREICKAFAVLPKPYLVPGAQEIAEYVQSAIDASQPASATPQPQISPSAETLTPRKPQYEESGTQSRVLDAGHRYQLLCLDGNEPQVLQFVKRCDLANPERFPGNMNAYPGTTLQSVMRALIDRVCYLQDQIPCDENIGIINNLRNCLYLLEHRAMRRHGLDASTLTIDAACERPMCAECGHVYCPHEVPPVSSPEAKPNEVSASPPNPALQIGGSTKVLGEDKQIKNLREVVEQMDAVCANCRVDPDKGYRTYPETGTGRIGAQCETCGTIWERDDDGKLHAYRFMPPKYGFQQGAMGLPAREWWNTYRKNLAALRAGQPDTQEQKDDEQVIDGRRQPSMRQVFSSPSGGNTAHEGRSESAESGDTKRLDYLQELIRNCPHAQFTFSDEPDCEEGACGFMIRVEGCRGTHESCALTLRDAIDKDMEGAKR